MKLFVEVIARRLPDNSEMSIGDEATALEIGDVVTTFTLYADSDRGPAEGCDSSGMAIWDIGKPEAAEFYNRVAGYMLGAARVLEGTAPVKYKSHRF